MKAEGSRHSSPERLVIDVGKVRARSIDLDSTRAATSRVLACLAPDERERAEGFVFERDRRRFAVAKAVLRAVLGRYLEIRSDQVAFVYGPQGNPTLAGAGADSTLRFNISHPQRVGLIAVTWRCDIGVDIEGIRPMPDLELMSKQCFSRQEAEAFLRVPPEGACVPSSRTGRVRRPT